VFVYNQEAGCWLVDPIRKGYHLRLRNFEDFVPDSRTKEGESEHAFEVPVNPTQTFETFTVDRIRVIYSDGLFDKFGSFSETNNQIIYSGRAVRITYKSDEPALYGGNFKSMLRLEIGQSR
jgi:hypothetical protein